MDAPRPHAALPSIDMTRLLVDLANFHVLAGEFALAVSRGLADPADWPTVLTAFADDPDGARRALHPEPSEGTES